MTESNVVAKPIDPNAPVALGSTNDHARKMTVSQKLRRIANILDIAPELAIPVVVNIVLPDGKQETVSNCTAETATELMVIALAELNNQIPPPKLKAERRKAPKRGKR